MFLLSVYFNYILKLMLDIMKLFERVSFSSYGHAPLYKVSHSVKVV